VRRSIRQRMAVQAGRQGVCTRPWWQQAGMRAVMRVTASGCSCTAGGRMLEVRGALLILRLRQLAHLARAQLRSRSEVRLRAVTSSSR
jgi:hypothetical protein